MDTPSPRRVRTWSRIGPVALLATLGLIGGFGTPSSAETPGGVGELGGQVASAAVVTGTASRESGLEGLLAVPDGVTAYPALVPSASIVPDEAVGGCIARPLKAGDTGTDVATLQWLLRMLGQHTTDRAGTFGLSTAVAVGAVQGQFGLFADGIAGPAFLDQVREACGSDRSGVAAVVSDSLLALTERELVRGLIDEGYRVVAFDAVGGSRMETTYDPDDLPIRASVAWRIRQIDARHHPSLWVVSAGGNDALQLARAGGDPASEVREGITAVLEALGSADTVWVEPWLENVNWTTYDDAELVAGIGRALVRAAGSRPRLVVAPWSALATAPGSVVFLPDGIHPGNAVTRHLLVTQVMEAVAFL